MRRRHLRAIAALAACLVVSSCADCGDAPRPPAESQTPAPGAAVVASEHGDDEAIAELRRRVAEPPSGPAVAADVLAARLPERVGTFVSRAPAKQRVYDLGNGGRLTSVRRDYVDVGDTLAVELVDASHAPLARAIITQMQGDDRSTETEVFRGAVMRGLPGILQWSKKTRLARAGVVIANRFVVNAEVGPSEDERAAQRIMGQLDLDAVVALANETRGSRPAEAPPAPAATPAAEPSSP